MFCMWAEWWVNLNLSEYVWIPGGEGQMLPIFGRSGQGRNGNTWHGALRTT